jgi:hypothetical protein
MIFNKTTSETYALLGVSNSYFRYGLRQSFMYALKQRYAFGPWIETSKFENGTKEGSIKANILKLGVSLNLNL